MRVALEVARRENKVLHLDPVEHAEAPAEVVEALTELRFPVRVLVFAGVRMEADVAFEFERRVSLALWRSDLAAAQTAGQVDPAVRGEHRLVHPQLGALVRGEAGEQHSLDIRLAVAVGVLKVEYVRGASDNQAIAPWHQAVGKGESAGELGAFVEATITVGVFQQADDARRLACRAAGGVAAILRDIKTP